jgi:hypothetical protein
MVLYPIYGDWPIGFGWKRPGLPCLERRKTMMSKLASRKKQAKGLTKNYFPPPT